MKQIEVGPLTVHWTAWAFDDPKAAHSAYAKTYHWIKQKPSRSASVWRLANPDRTRWFVVSLSEHGHQVEVIERRLAKLSGSWYEMPERDLRALVMRRVGDAVSAAETGRGTTTERHMKGRYKLMPDGTLEPVDRPQG